MNARELLELPKAKYREVFDNMPSKERGELERELDNIAQAAAWAYGYAEQRYGSGCGDQGHEDAVKEANKTLAGVRKVLGYTYPKNSAVNV